MAAWMANSQSGLGDAARGFRRELRASQRILDVTIDTRVLIRRSSGSGQGVTVWLSRCVSRGEVWIRNERTVMRISMILAGLMLFGISVARAGDTEDNTIWITEVNQNILVGNYSDINGGWV